MGQMIMKHIYISAGAGWAYELLDKDLYIWGVGLILSYQSQKQDPAPWWWIEKRLVLYNDPDNALSYTDDQTSDIENLISLSHMNYHNYDSWCEKKFMMLPKPIFYTDPKIGIYCSNTDGRRLAEVYYEKIARVK